MTQSDWKLAIDFDFDHFHFSSSLKDKRTRKKTVKDKMFSEAVNVRVFLFCSDKQKIYILKSRIEKGCEEENETKEKERK